VDIKDYEKTLLTKHISGRKVCENIAVFDTFFSLVKILLF